MERFSLYRKKRKSRYTLPWREMEGGTDIGESFMHVCNAETYRVILLLFHGLTMVIEVVTH